MIRVTSKGSDAIRKRFEYIRNRSIDRDLHRWGAMGLEALQKATPVDTRLSADSWGYRIERDKFGPRIVWYNTNSVNGTPVVILIQYGHGTGTGGYVPARDFINPSIRPVFDQIRSEMRKKVRS